MMTQERSTVSLQKNWNIQRVKTQKTFEFM